MIRFVEQVNSEWREKCINCIMPAYELSENVTSHRLDEETFRRFYSIVEGLKFQMVKEVQTHYRLDDETMIVYPDGQMETFLLTSQRWVSWRPDRATTPASPASPAPAYGWDYERSFYIPLSTTRFKPVDKYHDISQYIVITFSNEEVCYKFEILHNESPKEIDVGLGLVGSLASASCSLKIFVYKKDNLYHWLNILR
jgi:hypothetical protein